MRNYSFTIISKGFLFVNIAAEISAKKAARSALSRGSLPEIKFRLRFLQKSSRSKAALLRRGAGDRGRTGTVSLPLDFESSTSANSITPASVLKCLSIITDSFKKINNNFSDSQENFKKYELTVKEQRISAALLLQKCINRSLYFFLHIFGIYLTKCAR